MLSILSHRWSGLDYSAVEVCQCEGPHGDSDKFASNEKNPILRGFIQLSVWLTAGPEIQERSKSIPGPRIIGTYLRSLPARRSWLLSLARCPRADSSADTHHTCVFPLKLWGLLVIVIFIDPVSASVTLSSTPWWIVSLCPRWARRPGAVSVVSVPGLPLQDSLQSLHSPCCARHQLLWEPLESCNNIYYLSGNHRDDIV